MKVHELLNENNPPKLTKSAIESLPKPDPKNIKDRYKVDTIAFDNIKGIGAIPYNQEVDFMGFAIEMKPATFLKFAAAGDRSAESAKISKLIETGTPIGAPSLWLKLNYKEYKKGEPLRVEVVGHEGRARMMAIQSIAGNKEVPVHIFLKDGLRAHSLDEKFFTDFREAGMIPEKLNISPMKLEAGQIFWMGKIV